MSKIKVVYIDRKQDKIEFTKKELEELLEQTYNDGWHDGYNSTYHITYSGNGNNDPTTTPYTDWWKYPSITYSSDSISSNHATTTAIKAISSNNTENKTN